MAALPRAPVRQTEIVYPTPLIGDVLFSEMVDTTRNAVPAYGTAHPNTTKWPNHKLVYAREATAGDSVRDGTFEFFYAADRANQDLYNFNFSKADIGGTKFDAVTRTYVTLRSAFTPNTPAMGAAMPNTPAGLFTGSYVLAERSEKRIGDQVLDSLYVAEELTYVKRCTIRDIGMDDLNGRSLTTTTTLHYATEVVSGGLSAASLFSAPTNAYWGLQDNGSVRAGKQLSCEWYLIEERQLIAGDLEDGVLAIGSYTTNDNYYWPPVLETFDLMDWERLDGGVEIYPAVRFHPEGYNGPCLTTITRTWKKEPFTDIPAVEIMQPTRIYYASPFFTANIPECLHEEVAFQSDTGNTDPVYDQNTGSTRYYAATNETTWPATIIAFDDQEPFRGGYLRTTRVVTAPPIPANVGFSTGIPLTPPP